MTCMHTLSWYELVPVLSFLFQRGRCRSCFTRISWQYPLVELASGAVFAVLFIKFAPLLYENFTSFGIIYLFYAIIFSLILVISVYDLKHKIIPDKLSFLLGALSFLGLFFISSASLLTLRIPTIIELLAGPIIAAPFFLLWLVSRGAWMGLGDAKLALGLGWAFGLSVALSGIVLSFWIGTIFGIGLIIFKRGYGLKSEIPFAPYLALGSIIAFFLELNFFNIYF